MDARLAPVISHLKAVLDADGRLPVDLYHLLHYQLGWRDEAGRPTTAQAGKGVRPLLCLTACRAVGGDFESAIVPAAAIELTHEFSLIHDDIEDRDELRRGRRTLWTVVGEAKAINAGDALFALARRQLSKADLDASALVEIMRRYDEACLRLAEGQHMDLTFETQESVSEPEYLEMVERKTGALLAAAASLGAIAGGSSLHTADALADYARSVGIAFQIQDDILGIWGSEQSTGKPAGRDLERRKKTMPVVLAMADADLASHIAGLFEQQPSPEAASEFAQRLEAAGLRARTRSRALKWSDRALSILEGLSLLQDGRRELRELARRAVERDR